MLRMVQGFYAAVVKALHLEVGQEQNRDKLIDAIRRVGISPVSSMTTAALTSAFASDRELLATAQNDWLYTNRHSRLVRELHRQANGAVDDIERRDAHQGPAP